MTDIEKQRIELECPGCKREIEISYYNLINRREARCMRCSSSLKIQSMNASRLSQALRYFERAQSDVQKELEEAIEKAELNIKRR